MPYYFDNWGWLTSEVLPGRATNVVPPEDIPEGKAANWTGHKWLVINYSAPAVYVPEPEVLPNPTRRQINLALLQVGLLDTVEYAVANSGDRALQINYKDASDFDRNSDLVIGLGMALGKTAAELDAIWELARRCE